VAVTLTTAALESAGRLKWAVNSETSVRAGPVALHGTA
jgi:hypothetical protein